MKNHVCMVSLTQSEKKISKCLLRQSQSRSYARAIKPPGQNYFVLDTKGQNSFVPRTEICPWDKTGAVSRYNSRYFAWGVIKTSAAKKIVRADKKSHNCRHQAPGSSRAAAAAGSAAAAAAGSVAVVAEAWWQRGGSQLGDGGGSFVAA